MTDISSIVQNYVDLLIIQYADKPKARAVIELFTSELLANGVMFDVENGYNLDTAIGVQLDIIGKYVGIDRFYISKEITGIRFGYSNAFSSEPVGTTGYANAGDFLTKVTDFLSASEVIGNGFALSDDDFRILIKLKIILNYSNFSNKEIDDALFSVFGNSLAFEDNFNMSLECFTSNEFSTIISAAIDKKLLPIPIGVRLNHLIQKNIYFGYSTAPLFEALDTTGYASAVDFLTKTGMFLGNDNFV